MNDTDRSKFWLRRTVAALFFYSGAEAFRRCLTGRDRVLVLMYHRVVDPTDLDRTYIQPGIYVTRETFEMQIFLEKVNLLTDYGLFYFSMN